MIESAKKIGRDVNPSYIWRYKKKLKEGNVGMFTQTKVAAITAEGVGVTGPDGTETVVPADTVVIANTAAEDSLLSSLEEKFGEVQVIGDAAMPRRAHNATMDGHKVGLAL